MNFKAEAQVKVGLNHVDSIEEAAADDDDTSNASLKASRKHKKKKTRTKVGASNEELFDATVANGGFDEKALRETIADEDEFVRRLINTVPPSIYFDAETLAQINAQKHARADEKLEVAGVKRRKKLSKKAKFQRTKMDPDQQKSVTDIQEELAKQGDDEDDDDDDYVEVVLRPTSDRSNSIEELRQRLQNKLASFRGGKTCPNMSDVQEKKRLRRRMKKLKSKEKNKSKDPILKITPKDKLGKKLKTKEIPLAKPVFNKEGKMVFSKFDFTESGVSTDASGKRKRKGEFSGKDYKKLLSRVQRDEKKLDELRQKDEGKARVVQEKTAWKTAIDRAEGLKVKTDPDLLKKALKRKEYRKKKTVREWSERTEQVQRRKDAKQKKRRDNIQTRKKDKIKSKIKKAVKRGRLVPGFS